MNQVQQYDQNGYPVQYVQQQAQQPMQVIGYDQAGQPMYGVAAAQTQPQANQYYAQQPSNTGYVEAPMTGLYNQQQPYGTIPQQDLSATVGAATHNTYIPGSGMSDDIELTMPTTSPVETAPVVHEPTAEPVIGTYEDKNAFAVGHKYPPFVPSGAVDMTVNAAGKFEFVVSKVPGNLDNILVPTELSMLNKTATEALEVVSGVVIARDVKHTLNLLQANVDEGKAEVFPMLKVEENFSTGNANIMEEMLGDGKNPMGFVEANIVHSKYSNPTVSYDHELTQDYLDVYRIDNKMTALLNERFEVGPDARYRVSEMNDIGELKDSVGKSTNNSKEVATLRLINEYLFALAKVLSKVKAVDADVILGRKLNETSRASVMYDLSIGVVLTDTAVIGELTFARTYYSYIGNYSPALDGVIKGIKAIYKNHADQYKINIYTKGANYEVITDTEGKSLVRILQD